MTDLIHEPEHRGEEKKTPAYTPPKTEKEGFHRIFTYSAILLCAALALMALSFLANNRSNREIQDRLTTMQSAIESKEDLQERLTEALAQLKTAQESSDAYRESNERAASALCAMDWLREIEREYAAGHKEAARTLIEGFEDNDLTQHLPSVPLHTNPDGCDAVPPAEVYAAIVAELFPDGV